MPQRFQREVILIGLLAILLVQLCPMFEDPTPLNKVRHPYQPIIVVFFLLSLMIVIRRTIVEREQVLTPAVPVLDLTCVRLC
jgi:hypothetical protein